MEASTPPIPINVHDILVLQTRPKVSSSDARRASPRGTHLILLLHGHETRPLKLLLEVSARLGRATLLRETLEEEVEVVVGEVARVLGVRRGGTRGMWRVLESELDGDESRLLVHCGRASRW